mgnify:CR=1 FL=1
MHPLESCSRIALRSPDGECTSASKPVPMVWPKYVLRTIESVICVGRSQARVPDWWLPWRNSDT